jgi:CRP/FNR family transcriptional regulator, cyclic AMP receptor protein
MSKKSPTGRNGSGNGIYLQEPDSLGSADLHFPESMQVPGIYPAGTVLFEEGESPKGIFLLCRGAVKLSMGSPHDDRTITRVARPGEMLGLSSAICGEPHEATAQTIVNSELLFVSRKDFLQFVHDDSAACWQVVLQLSRNLEAAYDWVRKVASVRIRHLHGQGFLLRDDHHIAR